MLRVTAKKADGIEIWDLEGKLAGEWVKELDRCWIERTPEPGIRLQVNLKAVGYIDEAGKQLLSRMCESGVDVTGCGCMTRAVVEQIRREAEGRGAEVPIKKILALVLFGVCILSGTTAFAASHKSIATPSCVQNFYPGSNFYSK